MTLALLSQPRWITRTVESIRFVDRNVVSRRVVRHFVVPREEAARPKVNSRFVVPVFAVRKGDFISCDLLDGAGHSVTLAPLQDRCKLSYLALLDITRKAGLKEEDGLYEHLWHIVESPREVELEDFEAFLTTSLQGRELMRSKMYEVVRFMARNYLIYRSVPEVHRAEDQVLTMRLERRVPDTRGDFDRAGAAPPGRWLQLLRWLGLASHEFRHEFIQSAGSTHIEVEAPDGIALGYRHLDYLGYGIPPKIQLKPIDSFEARGTSKRRARFLVPRTAPNGTYAATINLRPGAGVMRDGPQAVAGLLAGLILLVIARRSHIDKPSLIEAAATLLLVLPALVALVAARPAEHPRVTRVIVGPRILTLTVVPLASIAAYTLITDWPTWVLWVLAGLSVALTVELFLVYFLARYATRMATVDALFGDDSDARARIEAAAGQADPPIHLPEMTRIG
ncbi:MAG TPA: hypothetical protein VMT37_16270 [Solirubrobacterales bacterium]|nr:hypothetical protein [Solirubrobacterales bacterium]